MPDAARAARRQQSPLRQMRERRGLTQQDLSWLSGASVSSIERAEAGKAPTLPILVNLSIALECELAEILDPAWLEWTELAKWAPKRPPAGAWRDPYGKRAQ